MENQKQFNDVLYAFPDRISKILRGLSSCVKQNTSEIRLRAGLPLALTVKGETVFVRENSTTQFFISTDLLKAETEDLQTTFKKLCNNSVYAHQNELKNGFISMKNGCRAGVCGNLTSSGFMEEVSSINIRIAHEISGCANDILEKYTNGGLLIVGPPGSGKTTVLRDLIRQISNGVAGKIKRVCVIDARNEISLLGNLGVASDVLFCEDKAKGIEIALRTMFPDVIAFDEIGNSDELKSVSESFNAGVDIITTAHAGSIEELINRNVTSSLLNSGAISHIALLPRIHGNEIKVIPLKELFCDLAV